MASVTKQQYYLATVVKGQGCVMLFIEIIYIAADKTGFVNQKVLEKVLIFFLLLHKNICCGYSLEVPQ